MKKTITVDSEEVVIDSSRLTFSEATLSIYMQTENAWYDYFGMMLALAEKELQVAEHNYEVLYSNKLIFYKTDKTTEKLAIAKAEVSDDVMAAKLKIIDAKLNVKLLQQHLRAWDKNHDAAMNFGHFLRKEMEKMNFVVNDSDPNDLLK